MLKILESNDHNLCDEAKTKNFFNSGKKIECHSNSHMFDHMHTFF